MTQPMHSTVCTITSRMNPAPQSSHVQHCSTTTVDAGNGGMNVGAGVPNCGGFMQLPLANVHSSRSVTFFQRTVTCNPQAV